MKILYAKHFNREVQKLSRENQKRVREALDLFEQNPFAPSLRNHALQGTQKGNRSISAGYDLRLIFIERDGYTLILFVDVGSHDDVYR